MNPELYPWSEKNIFTSITLLIYNQLPVLIDADFILYLYILFLRKGDKW